MKKFIKILLVVLTTSIIFVGCSNKNEKDSATKTIKIGASVTPHSEILGVTKDILAEQGYTLEIVEYNDYVIPNTATQSGELLANYFQHQPYLTNFNELNGTTLVSVASIHYEPFGIYEGKTKSLSELNDGAIIAVPNDGTNEARALYLLEAQGLIKLKPNVGLNATIIDIESNPKNLVIKEIEAAQLARSLLDVDLAVINGNYAIEAGLKVNNALALEDKNSETAQTFGNIVVVKEGNENNEEIKALVNALKSDKVKNFINEKYENSVIPLF